jgi:predicted DNA-binding helix-hairpin-helix protein
LIEEAGRWADRISLNVELPTAAGLAQLAPEKNLERTRVAMNGIRERIENSKAARRESS